MQISLYWNGSIEKLIRFSSKVDSVLNLKVGLISFKTPFGVTLDLAQFFVWRKCYSGTYFYLKQDLENTCVYLAQNAFLRKLSFGSSAKYCLILDQLYLKVRLDAVHRDSLEA